MNDAELFDLIPAYALGALSEEERTQVDALLARSPEARAELSSYAETMVGMAALTPRQPAPAHLTADFKARLAKEAQPRTPVITPLRIVLAIAALIVVVFGVYLGYRAIDANNRQQQINAIVANASAQHITLQPQASSTGTVEVITVPNADKAVVVAALPTLPSDRQYQAWIIVDSTPRSMGVFSMTATTEQVLLDIPVQPNQQDYLFGITVEPAGGSLAPTTSPIFLAIVKQTGARFPLLALAW
ncbi:MAG: anti-sigma factor [Anaerolineae bacterium]|nr:anti-sigma factor [Anaerolineae bacterium]